jgi:hypothetical protein
MSEWGRLLGVHPDTAEIANHRANIETVLTIAQRLDATVGRLLDEVHALQARSEHHGHLPFEAFDKTACQP